MHWSAGLFGYFPTYQLGNVDLGADLGARGARARRPRRAVRARRVRRRCASGCASRSTATAADTRRRSCCAASPAPDIDPEPYLEVPPREVRVRVCVIGAGAIGSLLAAHLAKVADVLVLTRREDHARALNDHGLRVSGRHDFTARVTAACRSARAARLRPRHHRDEGDRARSGGRSRCRGPIRRARRS